VFEIFKTRSKNQYRDPKINVAIQKYRSRRASTPLYSTSYY
jgi:hypothetical protein